ncbi:MAG: hypothetical protein LBC85_02260 [Fibromonadaceae bacterium]|jgi:hypothetical protein|nr:hypothetical protein [Fibromonadaceae bacterium]
MNKLKSIAAVSAAVLLSATMASAQAVGTIRVDNTDWTNYSGDPNITFSVAVAQTINLTVTDDALDESDLLMTTSGNIAIGHLQQAGIIDVETTVAAWDILITADNGGRLINTAAGAQPNDFLKVVRSGNVDDAVLRINVCTGAVASGGTDCVAPANIAQGAVIGATPNTAPISLATVLGRATLGGFRRGTDTDAGGNAHFILFAGIQATESELAGNGTYTENLSVTLVSWY